MKRIDATWVWETISQFHCGSGLSRPGHADRTVQVDLNGNPVLTGDAVKGALRMSSEQVMAWLGSDDCDYHSLAHPGSAEPQHTVRAALFGGSGQHHFSGGKLQDAMAVRWATPASTAIDRKTGTAKDGTLRRIEVAEAGLRFDCKCTIWLESDSDELRDSVVTLLSAAIAATESIGAKAGIGWGRIRTENLTVSVDGVPTVPTDALLPERLAMLGRSDTRLPEEPRGRTTESDSRNQSAPIDLRADVAPGALRWWKLEVHLDEPTCLGSRPDVSNQIATLDSIPATALRGALRAAWLRMGKGDDELVALLGMASRWTPAVPSVRLTGDWNPCVPVPLSYLHAKGEQNFGGVHGIHDLSTGTAAPRSDPLVPGRTLQWQSIRQNWMSVVPGAGSAIEVAAGAMAAGATETRMHVARNYMTGSKRAGALFSREALSPAEDRAFIAYVGLPAGIKVEWPAEILLGKRRTAGNGAARLGYYEAPGPGVWSAPSGTQPPAGSATILIQLLSPAIVRNPEGFPLRTLRAAAWGRLLWPAGALGGWEEFEVSAFNAARRIPGWMNPWRHGRAGVTCLSPGSVWRLACANEATAANVRARLHELAVTGIGERTNEGFGWLVVDPPWLGNGVDSKPAGGNGGEVARGRRLPWPGCAEVPVAKLKTMAARAQAAALRPGWRVPLVELLARARQFPPASVLEHAAQMAGRNKPRNAWAFLDPAGRQDDGQHVRQLLQECAIHAALFRFILEALVVRLTSVQEQEQ